MILLDEEHSDAEQRFYCIGKVGDGILTVRFTYRNNIIRIFGAGYWRKGNKRDAMRWRFYHPTRQKQRLTEV